MEWYTAMGLMLTLVWLYLEILRFVSYFIYKKSCVKMQDFYFQRYIDDVV